MFDWLIHSKTRLRMMKLFFKESGSPLYGLEIAQALKASPGTTHRELNALLKQGIITKKKEGALVLYRLNRSHPYFPELKKAVFPKKKTSRILFISDLHLSVETAPELIDEVFLFLDYAEDNASELVLGGDIIEMLEGDVFQNYLFHKPLFDRLTELSREIKITYLVGNHDCFLRLLCQEGQAGKFFGANIEFAQEYVNARLNIFAAHGHSYDDFSNMKGGKASKNKASTGAELVKLVKQIDREGFSMHQNQLVEIGDYADRALQYYNYVKERKIDSSATLLKAAKQLIHENDYSYVVFGHSHKAMLKEVDHGIYFNTGSWKSEKKHSFVEIDNEGGALVALDELK